MRRGQGHPWLWGPEGGVSSAHLARVPRGPVVASQAPGGPWGQGGREEGMDGWRHGWMDEWMMR